MKNEPIKNELRAIWSTLKAKRILRDEMAKRDRREAGVIDQHEYQRSKDQGADSAMFEGGKL